MKEEKIEAFLLENIANIATQYKVEYELSQKKKKEPSTSKKTVEGKLAKLRELYINDLINIADYKREYDLLNNELKKLDLNDDNSEKDFSNLDMLWNSDFESMYHALDNLTKRTLWHTIIEKIILRDDGGFDIFFK
ncbi:hypothetical protein C3V36_01365 [Lachnospiraceae bacterium oral taxon 500]|nr:hypothetical protein C3V36_01365 [Lachnospiraceae bacterium oral taxon 500]